jgi:hypothetical protein
MSTLSINATTERPRTLRGRLSLVPWLTVLPLAVVLAYADGFWMVSLRGAVGAMGRTQGPFLTWLRESTLALPLFILAVLGALTLAAHWFGPVLHKPKAVVVAMLLIVAAGTLVGIAELAASSAYDYSVQSGHIQQMAMGSETAASQQAGFWLQMRSVGLGSGILLATNLLLVGWVVALRGGQLNVRKPRH